MRPALGEPGDEKRQDRPEPHKRCSNGYPDIPPMVTVAMVPRRVQLVTLLGVVGHLRRSRVAVHRCRRGHRARRRWACVFKECVLRVLPITETLKPARERLGENQHSVGERDVIQLCFKASDVTRVSKNVSCGSTLRRATFYDFVRTNLLMFLTLQSEGGDT